MCFVPFLRKRLGRDEWISVCGCVLCSGFVTKVGCVTKAGHVSRLGHPLYMRGRHPLAGAHSQRMELVRVQIAKYLFFGLTERVNTNVDCKIFALRPNATQAVTMARGRMAAGHRVGLCRVESE